MEHLGFGQRANLLHHEQDTSGFGSYCPTCGVLMPGTWQEGARQSYGMGAQIKGQAIAGTPLPHLRTCACGRMLPDEMSHIVPPDPVQPSKINKILVVDDEVMLCQMLKEFLEDADYQVEVAFDGESALQRIHSQSPDLLILDLNMPKISGYELLHLTSRSHPDMPKLILSGVRDIAQAMVSIQNGGWDFLPKPIGDLALLLDKVSELEEKAWVLKGNRQRKKRLEHVITRRTAELHRLSQEMLDAQKDIVVKLADVIETRSNETGNHVRRVAQMSRLLSGLYGLEDSQQEVLQMASPLHDVGKVGIPDSILNKPGKLTPEEFEQIKTHTLIGYNMLNNSKQPIIQAAAIIAYQHHEYWDGTGYPQGLQGEDIHIFGRITCLVDVYDALRQKRHYKTSWGAEEAQKYIRKNSGKIFDPRLTDLFLSHIVEMEEVIYEMGEARVDSLD